MTLKSLLWRKKYVMTSKIRHDVKKFLMMLKHVMTPKSSSWRQKCVMTSKSPSWRQKYVMTSNVKTRHDIKKITMTSKIRKKYVMYFDLFPEYFLTTIDPQLTKCDIGLWTHIYAQTHTHRQTHKHQLFNNIACEIKDRHAHKRQHYNNLALLMDIEFSIDKLMYKWRDMEVYMKISGSKLWSVRIVLCFVVFTNAKPLLHSI